MSGAAPAVALALAATGWLTLATSVSASDVEVLLRDHCARCHGGERPEGELDLSGGPGAIEHDAELLRRMVHVVELNEMPPEDERQPAPTLRSRALKQLRGMLQTAAKHTAPPTTPIRRLNRFQYNNAVQDLFQLKRNVFTLPERMMREHRGYFRPDSGKMPDVVTVGSRPLGKSQLIEPRLAGVAAFPQDLRAEHGFDNRADHLTLSPLLLESFIKLGRSIVESPDFNSSTCGMWNEWFAAPAEVRPVDLDAELRSRLRPLLTRAFREPVDDALLDRYCAMSRRQLDNGATFSDAMKSAAGAAIASPRFFYLYHVASEQDGALLSDYELASRLSFFLWGSLPDERLIELAVAGKLRADEVLAGEVERMLRDQRLKRFCDSFPSQWLQLERIVSSAPNREQFPDFYFAKYRSSMHMMLEPLLLFETILIENRSLLELIDSDFAYRSARLDRLYYGGEMQGNLNEVTTVRFQRIPLSDRRQGGVITNAAVMTMTSGIERTHPITRGAWLATVIFNDPPAPPPADVPPLPANPSAEDAKLTLRERLDAHRQRADCAACHQQIDPLGFALENFGPTGKWREQYGNGREIDPAGQLFHQHAFRDVVEFKDAILAEKQRFLHGFAAHLMSFALARAVTAADEPALEAIVARVAADDFRIQTLIKEVALSRPFRHQ